MLSRALPSVRRRALVMAIKRAHHPGAFGEKDTRFRQCLTSGAAGQLLPRSREAPELAGSKRGQRLEVGRRPALGSFRILERHRAGSTPSDTTFRPRGKP